MATKICVTVAALRNPKAILGQIHMEESLGNKVRLYPKNAKLLAEAAASLPDDVFQESMSVLSKMYSPSWIRTADRQKHAEILANNIRKITRTDLLDYSLQLIADNTYSTLDMSEEQLMYLAKKVHISDYREKQNSTACVMRMKDLYNYPAAVAEALRGEDVDEYVLGRILGNLNRELDREVLVKNWNVVWKELLKLGPVDHNSLECIIRYLGEYLVTAADENGFRIDFIYKPKEKPNEESKS